ncbi:hypothetical protein QFC22_000107 [Naganishia vaughanmartiniae]|uniref:Uncharacterized protein n=1 Tax=Naganishia vaughanmartiniae TaxID=1424756 RepID=A0ACC2XME2_9TREE|nr:hypothetical protein QFC22_000107 [Naganishia vaughanmartiniae]
MRTTSLASALAIIFLAASPATATGNPSSAQHRRSQRRSPSSFFANPWERRLPITATTTVTIEATSTQVVWVTATSHPGSVVPTGLPTQNSTADPSLASTTADWNSTTVIATSSSSSAVQTGTNYTSASEWWPTNSQSGGLSSARPTAKPNATRTENWVVVPTAVPSDDNFTTTAHHYDASSAASAFSSELMYSASLSASAPNATDVSSSTTLGWNETSSMIMSSHTTSHTASPSNSAVLSSSVASSFSASVTHDASASPSATLVTPVSSKSVETTEPAKSVVPSSLSSVPSSASVSVSASSTAKTTVPATSQKASSVASIFSSSVLSASSSSLPSVTSALNTSSIVSTSSRVTQSSSVVPSATSISDRSSTVPSVTSSSEISSAAPVSSVVTDSSSSIVTIPTTSSVKIPPSSSTIASSKTTSKVVSPSATPGSSLTTTPLNDHLVAAYYPDWSVWTFPPSNLDFSRLDVVDFAFAIVNAQYGLEFTQYNSEDTLKWLVSVAHAAGKRVRLSIGGWTGSVYFSPAVATEQNRQTLAQAMLSMYNKFDLDGIDLDWEYPGVIGSDSNIVSPDDSANYLIFLQLLRKTLPPTAILSAATQVWPFAGPTGAPLSDVSEFAKLLDWVMIMNYDIWGSSSTPGPNAPLSDGCGNSAQPLANAYAAVSSWTTAGMPAKQIMLGLPAYGYMQASSADSLRARKRRGLEKKGGATLYNADGGTSWGQIKFSDMVAQGGLARDSDQHWIGANGFTRYWDTCSSTVSHSFSLRSDIIVLTLETCLQPWLKSSETGQIITYDDPISISLKAQFARQAGLRGTNFWEITGDTSDWSLLDAARSGLGL